MPKSFLEVDGLYNPARRFAFTNITDEEFKSAWDGQPITVKPHQTIELPHHLMVKLTEELVNNLILGKAVVDEKANSDKPYYRSNIRNSQFIPAMRKQYEDQIVRELAVDEESPEIQMMRLQIRDELKRDLERKEGVPSEPTPASIEEFAQIKSGKTGVKAEKKPLKVKVI